MIRFGRRARRRLILLTVAGIVAAALIVCVVRWQNRQMRAAGHIASTGAPGTLRLPFTLPCAVYSGDASPVYAAIRGRDKNLLMDMVAHKRLMMVKQGTSVSLMAVSHTTIVSIYGGAREGSTCYVPSDIVPVIQRRVPR